MAFTIRPRNITLPTSTADGTMVRSVVIPERFDVHVTADFIDQTARFLQAGAVVRIDASRVLHIDLAGMDALAHTCKDLAANGVIVELEASTTMLVAHELVGRPMPAPGASGVLR